MRRVGVLQHLDARHGLVRAHVNVAHAVGPPLRGRREAGGRAGDGPDLKAGLLGLAARLPSPLSGVDDPRRAAALEEVERHRRELRVRAAVGEEDVVVVRNRQEPPDAVLVFRHEGLHGAAGVAVAELHEAEAGAPVIAHFCGRAVQHRRRHAARPRAEVSDGHVGGAAWCRSGESRGSYVRTRGV